MQRKVFKLNPKSNKLETDKTCASTESEGSEESDKEGSEQESEESEESEEESEESEEESEESDKEESDKEESKEKSTADKKISMKLMDASTQTKESELSKRKSRRRKKVFRLPRINPVQQKIINTIVGHDDILVYHDKFHRGTYISNIKQVFKKCFNFSAEKTDILLESICDEAECFIIGDYLKYTVINKRKVKQLLSKARHTDRH
jgi:hypothetical protein